MSTITKNMKYADILSVLRGERPAYGCDIATLTAFIEHEMELTAKKNAAPKRPSKATLEKQEDNRALAQVLYNEMFLAGKPLTVAECKGLPSFADVSSPKLTALLKLLILDAKVTKIEGKRVAQYQALA